MIHVSGLYTYPLKSAKGLATQTVVLDRFGLQGDRRFMLVDEQGKFITARTAPKLTLVVVRALHFGLAIALPNGEAVEVSCLASAPSIEVEVWGERVMAQRVSPEADRLFTDWLRRPASLVFMPETTQRLVDPAYGSANDTVSFADGFSVLLISQASLDALNRRLEAPVGMDRFRPNIVVDGCAPFAEDMWQRIRINGCTFDLVKPCARCVMVTVDPKTGEKGKEPLRTLSTFRARNGEVLFGQNLIHRSLGQLRVGDTVQVLDALPFGSA